MFEIPKFLYNQQPLFWWTLASVFFGLGFLYAAVAWKSYRRLLQRAQREQRALLEERQVAIEDRQRRWEQELQKGDVGKDTASDPESYFHDESVEPLVDRCSNANFSRSNRREIGRDPA